MAMRHASHFSRGPGARAMAGSSKTVAPASSLRTWLVITLPTARTYSGPTACAAAAAATSPGPVTGLPPRDRPWTGLPGRSPAADDGRGAAEQLELRLQG